MASEFPIRPIMRTMPRFRDDQGVAGGSRTSTSVIPGDWSVGRESKWCVSCERDAMYLLTGLLVWANTFWSLAGYQIRQCLPLYEKTVRY